MTLQNSAIAKIVQNVIFSENPNIAFMTLSNFSMSFLTKLFYELSVIKVNAYYVWLGHVLLEVIFMHLKHMKQNQ